MFLIITKIFRIIVIILLVLGAVYLGMRTYSTVYDFLDFQILFYKWFLQAGEQANGVKEYAGEMIDAARDFLGVEHKQGATNIVGGHEDISERIKTFAGKLQFIAGGVGVFVGIMSYKIGFSLVFGIKKTIHELKSFIFNN